MRGWVHLIGMQHAALMVRRALKVQDGRPPAADVRLELKS
jgi:hypothetical protein